MNFEVIGRITAHVTDDDVVLVNDDLRRAHLEYAAMQRTLPAKVARAVFEPPSTSVQLAGLAAYVMWLEEIHGDHDTDWLRA